MIVTDVGGLKSTIGDRGTGLVAPEADPSAIREEIIRFFSEEGIRERCVASIRSEKERLSWERFCSEMTSFAASL